MSPVEVSAALGVDRPTVSTPGRHDDFFDVGVRTYYGDSRQLMCVAVDALRGPQVLLDDLPLVGRVPSELADQFEDYVNSQGARVCISLEGDPGWDDIGLQLRAQRAGDFLLTRPVFAAREWSHRIGDSSEGPLPQEEWAVR
ncbi:hypothetical protein [Thermomonospora amylolytica]|uniref:hypothetical protein n=1 Tax=Thermomonospora amylolytica TaxID=1411117 RepID=UPI0018E53098|nr:hypothetical protein [Thermomonospora amylolytica]